MASEKIQTDTAAQQPKQDEQENKKGPQEANLSHQGGQQDSITNKDIPKSTSATYRPIAAERAKIDLPSHQINAQIHFMKDHALIGEFIGFWPTEKAL